MFDWLIKILSRGNTPFIQRETFVEDKTDDDDNLPHSDFENHSGQEDVNKNNKENMDEKTTLIDDQVSTDKLEGLVAAFLSTDFGPKGYRDALINPDTSNANSNKEILKLQLEIKIDQEIMFYKDKIKDFDFHIKTREENLMMDTVAELQSEKGKLVEKIAEFQILLNESKENRGKGHVVVLTYDQGFKRGLAAITASKLLGKNLGNE